MKVEFLVPAQKEVDAAVVWYEEQVSGLGQKFLDDLDRTIRRIHSFPKSSPEITFENYR
jgi:hypothetical protein